MASSSSSPSRAEVGRLMSQPSMSRGPMPSPGLLLTHDWGQVPTERCLLDTIVSEIRSQDYKTLTFPINDAAQYQAFVNGKVIFCAERVEGCPVQLVDAEPSSSADSCPARPLSAVVKMKYKLTHTQSPSQDRPMSDDVIAALQDIEEAMFEKKDEIPRQAVEQILQKFGSHFPLGMQHFGKCFTWSVVVDGMCDMNVLTEISDEIFAICTEHVQYFPASGCGIWYNIQQLLNTTAWSREKKQLLASVKLRVAQSGRAGTDAINLTEWEASNQSTYLFRLVERDQIVSIWDLMKEARMEFQRYTILVKVVKDCWKHLVEDKRHCQVSIPADTRSVKIPGLGCPWENLMEELNMGLYFPNKLSLQHVRSLRRVPSKTLEKGDLPWRTLEQIIAINSQCRELHISQFAQLKKAAGKTKFGQTAAENAGGDQVGKVPHPMDMMLLLFACSDFMLRQVLARKLFMCRLAIPFLVPTADNSVEMLLWPLRSIIMEWRDGGEAREEALVSSQINKIAVMRYGQTKFSKSKLMNDVLSPSGHSVFFHQGAPCGNEKRIISNGTVEMTHFLPGENKQDQFSQPALFFNLRGNACDYPVQRGVLMDLATVLVVVLDISQLGDTSVKVMLDDTIKRQQANVVVILTDSQGHRESDIKQVQKCFNDLVGDAINDLEIVTTFEHDGSGQKNTSSVIQDTRDALSAKMAAGTDQSLERYAAIAAQHQCVVDEIKDKHCSTGKEICDDILGEMMSLDILERKKKLLPQQGDCLTEIGKLLRRLHRSIGKDASFADKEAIKKSIKTIRHNQSVASKDDHFITKVISLFGHPGDTKAFAIRWVQLELDGISRRHLPALQAEKNKLGDELMKASNEDDTSLVQLLKGQVYAAEKKINAATCGWEHLMREVGQLYEVSKDLNKMDRKNSMYHLSALPDIVGRQLLEGHPVELMDGDHGFLPIAWVKSVLQSLATIAGHGKKIFVLSVLGIQSSGKSTLLNTMFGLEFAVSAGRCTRGIYAQLLPVVDRKDLPFDYMLVLDSEGLRAHDLEEQNYEHDNELATLVIGLADLAVINIKGENVKEMSDVLQIVVHAFLRMKLADSPHRRQVMFFHQNVAAVNAQEKLAVERQKLHEQLNNMTRQASVAQGLSETITSFNRIISFDSQQNVVYFSDLWHGSPPMATINQGYSICAAETRQRLLQDISDKFSGFITIADFMRRVEDMWNGVLTDDFIFSFRSSLAAKAYIEVEREFARLTLLIEQELLQWVNSYCKVQIGNCKSETDLHQCCSKLKVTLKARLAELVTQNLGEFNSFFEKHTASDIIAQWKSEKVSSFRMFGQALERQTENDLENMKVRKQFELRQKSASQTHEQEIIRRAIAVAESVRGKRLSDEELHGQFEQLWNSWSSDLMSTASRNTLDVMSAVQSAIWDKMSSDGNAKDFTAQSNITPIVMDESRTVVTPHDVTKDHIMLKDRPFTKLLKDAVHVQIRTHKSHFISEASEKATAMMKIVLQEVEKICQQDTMFNSLHGRQIMDLLWNEIEKHNNLPFATSEFAFTSQFKAMMAIRVASVCVPKFERMSQLFEDKYGVQAQMNAYKGRVFVLFKNTVNQASAEVTASDDFCEAMKTKVIQHIKLEVEQSVLREIYQAVGNTKYDLIIKVLDEIAQTEDFVGLMQYVAKPVQYARSWTKMFEGKHIFTIKDGETKYNEVASREAGKIFAQIVSSASAATQAASKMEGSQQYSTWIAAFCEQMKTSLALDPEQLKVASSCNIKSFSNFQKFLESDLQKLEKEIKADFSKTTSESVTWLDEPGPYIKVCNRLWGCKACCPFCTEPCQYTDENHSQPHSCLQHRPPGIGGTRWRTTDRLTMETCGLLISMKDVTFGCDKIKKLCRNTPHCTAKGDETAKHYIREYKKYLPDWDIAPDPASEAYKYWQWAACTFHDKLLEIHPGTKLDLPESWKETTKQEAIDSLRLFQ